jgi:hypothetical protein
MFLHVDLRAKTENMFIFDDFLYYSYLNTHSYFWIDKSQFAYHDGSSQVSSKFEVYKFLVVSEILVHSFKPSILDYTNRECQPC